MIVGHPVDGNFREAVMYNKKHPEQVAIVRNAVQKMTVQALEMEGTCTVTSFCSNVAFFVCGLMKRKGEHSIAMFRKGALMQELGIDTVKAMRSIKLSLDPNWIPNPETRFDSPA